MQPGRSADVRLCLLASRWLPAALALLLLLSCSFSRAYSSTLEHDFQIVHNVDNRSPEIDPFWYVGRGVRPIGRFGKRHSSLQGTGGVQPVLRTLGLLLHSLRNKQSLEEALQGEDRDWLP
ncbi:prolactin releasing hormone 2 [Eleginops maclovinus]|uniref:prolactin releasing hormone 2 n=1 Tax=Eleginops maclovinus TaxID=56733 RepID=UPI00307FFA92